jgi:hypothetical protein
VDVELVVAKRSGKKQSQIMSVYSYSYKNGSGSFIATVTDTQIICVNTINDKKSIGIFNETHYPEECNNFDNFKLAMERVGGGDGNKLCIAFSKSDVSNCRFKYGKEGDEFAYSFVVRLQPYILRTNAIILAEIETYMKSIDNHLQQLFARPEEHCKFFGIDLVEKKEEFNVENAISKIVEISGLTKDEFMNKPQFCVFVERLNVINDLHKKFVERIKNACGKFCEELPAFLMKHIDRKYTTNDLQCVVKGRIESCLVNTACIDVIPVYEFNMGKLADMCVKQNDFYENDSTFYGSVNPVANKIVAKIVSGELLPDVPRFIINVGKLDKMIFGKDFDNEMVFGQAGFDAMMNTMSSFHPDLSVSVIQTAFKHPDKNGILIDETDANLNEMQQHLISVLNEKYDEWVAKQSAIPNVTSSW